MNHRDKYGNTPLYETRGQGIGKSVVDLLEAGADPLLKNKGGFNFVDWVEGQANLLPLYKVPDPWFRKAYQMLAERGLVKPPPEEVD